MTLQRPIEPDGCGCEAADPRRGLVSIDAALRRIAEEATPVAGTEDLALGRAAGRVLAAPVVAQTSAPPFDSAAMDGYALDSAALSGAGPWTLDVSGRVAAGCDARPSIGTGQAVRIFTGAPLPEGTDTVVMQEHVQRAGDAVRLHRRPAPGENVRLAGEDIAHGDTVLRPGCRIGPRQIAAASAAGARRVVVRRRVRIGLLVTGDEVTGAEAATLETGAIWDVNAPFLTAELDHPCFDLVRVAHGHDNPGTLARQFTDLASETDIFVTTGGVSVGDEDHVKPAFRAAGGEILFSGVAVKPGKPVSFGRLGCALWLGLPGNPLSAFVTFRLLGVALMRALLGETGGGTPRRNVVTSAPIRRRPGRCELRPARLVGFDGHGREVALCEDATHSGRVAGLPPMDGLMFLPAETDHLPAGALVEFLPFARG